MEILLYEYIESGMAQRFISNLKNCKGPVTVAINSGGGSVVDGFAMFNALRTYTGHTVARIDGLAASMATVVALAADRVAMADNAFFMVHNPWSVAAGNAEDMKKMGDLLEKMQSTITTAYVAKTGKTAEEIAALMDAETWMTAEEAREMGFIDDIYPAEDQPLALNQSCFAMLKQFSNAPAGLLARASTDDAQKKAEIIFSAAGGVDLSGIRAEYDAGKLTIEQLRNKVLDEMAKGAEPAGGAHIYAGNGNLVGDSITASIEHRLGRGNKESDNRYNGYSLKELARAALQDRGVSCHGKNSLEMIGMAFTHSSSDFGNILFNVATKSMLLGWENAPETFPAWTKKGSLPDFKQAYRAGLDGFPRLREVRPGAEYKYITTSDRAEPIALATYGELFSIDRQTIINDDLSALSRIPEMMGAAAKATIGDLVYSVMFSNPKMSNGKYLFHTEHHNFIDGALTLENLAAARSYMRKQKNAAGQTLNITPQNLIVSAASETLAEQLIRSVSVPGQSNSGVHNPMRDSLTILTEPRLDDNNEKEWFLTAAAGTDTVEVAYLDGNDTPWLESTDGFTVDGTTFKVRIDAGVAPLDWRGLAKSTGTAAQG